MTILAKMCKVFIVSICIWCFILSEFIKCDDFIVNCLNELKESDSTQCQTTVLKISKSFYKCELLGDFPNPPRRIAYDINNDIIVKTNVKTFQFKNQSVDEVFDSIQPKNVMVNEDKIGNRFYAESGMVFGIEKQTGNEFEVITDGNDDNYVSLYINFKTSDVFILNLSPNYNQDNKGSIFVFNTERLLIQNGTVKAENIDRLGDLYSSLVVNNDLDEILLGLTYKNRGKLVKLRRQMYDPCDEIFEKRLRFQAILNETNYELRKIFDESVDSNDKISVRFKEDNRLQNLEKMNSKLRQQLNKSIETIGEITSNLRKTSYGIPKLNPNALSLSPGTNFSLESPCFNISSLTKVNDEIQEIVQKAETELDIIYFDFTICSINPSLSILCGSTTSP